MTARKRKDVEEFIQAQKDQLGLDDSEVNGLMQEALAEIDRRDEVESERAWLDEPPDLPAGQTAFAAPAQAARPEADVQAAPPRRRKRGMIMTDPYLPQSQTIKARPTRVSRIRSVLYEHALPNEYIVQVGVKDAKPVLGARFFKPGRRFLKFPAAVQTVYFTSDNANKNYQGLKIDGYACWRIDPDRPEVAARSLDFADQDNPMGNTNRILRTICTEAIRHIIANISIEEALTKKDEIGRDLKAQLERIERTWGVVFDQVGIERVTILSVRVFDDLQQKTRDSLRLGAAESRMQTDRDIEKKKAEHTEEMERLQAASDKEARILRATTESEVHKVELDERAKREAEDRAAEEDRRRAEAEAADRAAAQQAEQAKRLATREAEIEAHKEEERKRLDLLKSAAEAEMRIRAAESEAEVAEATAKNQTAKAKAEQKIKLAELDLEKEKMARAQDMEDHLAAVRQTAELERAESRFRQKITQQRENDLAAHESESARLQCLDTEEQILNRVSQNRVLDDFVDRLPEIVSSLKIDRYTVLDGSGSSPLVHALGQMLALLEERGLGRLLKNAPEDEGIEE